MCCVGSAFRDTKSKTKKKKVNVLPIRKMKSNVSSVGPSSERNMPKIIIIIKNTFGFLFILRLTQSSDEEGRDFMKFWLY